MSGTPGKEPLTEAEAFAKKYPQHALIKTMQKELSTLQEFVDWLEQEKQITLWRRYSDAERSQFQEANPGERLPSHTDMVKPEDLFFEFLGADRRKFFDEKELMLEEIRAANDRSPAQD